MVINESVVPLNSSEPNLASGEVAQPTVNPFGPEWSVGKIRGGGNLKKEKATASFFLVLNRHGEIQESLGPPGRWNFTLIFFVAIRFRVKCKGPGKIIC